MNLTPAQHEDLEYLRQTMNWGYWPFCPVKRTHNGELQVASCYDGENGKKVVYLKNLFQGIDEGFQDAQTIPYNSSYDMLMDGWMVD